MTTDYQKQAEDFLNETKTEFKTDFVGNDFYFDDDKEKRDIYRITLKRNGKKYSFRFGQSIHNSSTGADQRVNKLDQLGYSVWSQEMRAARKSKKVPTAYDVLSCLTKNDPGTIYDFASEYGYRDVKPSKLQRIYASVVEEWEGVRLLFSDVIDKLQEIQ